MNIGRPFLNFVRVNGLRSSDGSPFQRTAPEYPRFCSRYSVLGFGNMQDVLRAPDIVVKITNREHILHVGGHLIVKCFGHDNCLLFY